MERTTRRAVSFKHDRRATLIPKVKVAETSFMSMNSEEDPQSPIVQGDVLRTIIKSEMNERLTSPDKKMVTGLSFSVVNPFTYELEEIENANSLRKSSIRGVRLQTLFVEKKDLDESLRNLYAILEPQSYFNVRILVVSPRAALFTRDMIKTSGNDKQKFRNSFDDAGLIVETCQTDRVIIGKKVWDVVANEALLKPNFGGNLIGSDYATTSESRMASVLSSKASIDVISFQGYKAKNRPQDLTFWSSDN